MKKGARIRTPRIWWRGRVIYIVLLFSIFILGGVTGASENPQRGGVLIQAIATEPPSYDAHKEYTYAVVHPTAPHYSLLLKFDPDNFPKIVGDLAESWNVSADHKTYTFKIHKGVKFHDGSLLTSRDVKASYDRIIFPPPGMISLRKALYSAVEKVEAPDDFTIIFRLKWPAASFMASMASPFNYIYKADILARDPKWYERNIMGTGPFKFVEHVAGSHWVGKRNEDYFVKGKPYLDGFRALFIKDLGARAAAIRAGRVHTEFRGNVTPPQWEDMARALGDKIQVQKTTLLITTITIFNCEKAPFNDRRVRRALTLALDRWEASKALSRIANVREVGGLLRPGSQFAMSEEELSKVAGFSRDIEASRKEARRLLREAGIPEGYSFEVIRPTAPNYQPLTIWQIDQWRQIGLNVIQKPQELGLHTADLEKGNFKVAISAISGFMDEPDLQFINFLSMNKSPRNWSRYNDRVLDDLYEKQSRAMDPSERKRLCQQFQVRVLDEMTYGYSTLWDNRIIPHSPKMKGWKGLPSHFLNADLADVWLDKD